MKKSSRSRVAGMLLGMGMLASGCTDAELPGYSSFGNTMSGLHVPESVDQHPSDQLISVAKRHFLNENYGHAARYYEQAVEVMPDQAEAWLGLAACYDRLRQFDRADRTYRQAARFIGNRPEYYNNVGYSHLLRGNVMQARRNFMKAYELDPDNPTIINNLELIQEASAGLGGGRRGYQLQGG